MMKDIPGCELSAVSGWYLTRPVGGVAQEWYVNGVAGLLTSLSAKELMGHLLRIESHMGRVRSERWEPRIIDLDILLFGSDIIDSKEVKVPHPLLHLRGFVLVPLAELAPNMIHPCFDLTIGELLKRLPEGGPEVVTLKE